MEDMINGNGKIKVDYQKAVKLAKAIVSEENKENILHIKKLRNSSDSELFPDAIVPEGIDKGCIEHALFLFHAVSIDSMRQSDQVYRAMREILEEIGSLDQLVNIDRKDLGNLLVPYFGEGIMHPKNSMTDPVGTLLHNAKRLEIECGGNPQLLKTRSVKKTVSKINEYHQFGVPKSALLMKNYVRSGLWGFSEYSLPIKVDRHTIRVGLGYGLIDLEGHLKTMERDKELSKSVGKAKEELIRMGHYSDEDFREGRVRSIRAEKLVLPLTETFQRVTSREKISAIELDDWWWATGKYGCGKNDAIYCETNCPVSCYTRPPSDNNANWFFPDVDKRNNLGIKNQLSLLTHLEINNHQK